MKKFQDICGGPDEASICNLEDVEQQSVKISSSTFTLSSISNLDYDILYLIWTTEKLQQQLDVIDGRYESCRVYQKEQTPSYTNIEDEDIQDELEKLELAIEKEALV
ncbi:hypothetical protein Ahy_B05g078207 [Arachis hypogaea]|uniref:Uncharacterized protein n=1 Tax=Arachis hypogaea TaxID=3818 RepID=A0A444Z6J3_ARAHY|nr:hypothetical protein Ahy_B05g078207 [Arachis hypogaea]